MRLSAASVEAPSLWSVAGRAVKVWSVQKEVVRSVGVALVGVVAVVAGFLGLTSLPAWITLLASLAIGSLALLLDLAFLRPDYSPSGRRSTLLGLGAIAATAALAASFAIGRHTQGGPSTYPFVVTGGSGGFALIKSVPEQNAMTGNALDAGTTVEIVCTRELSDAVWYQLSGSRGWLSEDDAIPAPYSGMGSAPTCPD